MSTKNIPGSYSFHLSIKNRTKHTHNEQIQHLILHVQTSLPKMIHTTCIHKPISN